MDGDAHLWLGGGIWRGNIVFNPGFEQGFTSWNNPGTAPSNWNDNPTFPFPHTGTMAANTDCFAGTSCLSGPNAAILYQDLTTVIGDVYVLSVWSVTTNDGQGNATPNELWGMLGGNLVLDVVNQPGDSVYRQYFSFAFTATDTTTRLQFSAYDVPANDFIDDVCVDLNGADCGTATVAPEPTSWALVSVALLALVTARRMRLIPDKTS
jgi:hypothetical protein